MSRENLFSRAAEVALRSAGYVLIFAIVGGVAYVLYEDSRLASEENAHMERMETSCKAGRLEAALKDEAQCRELRDFLSGTRCRRMALTRHCGTT